MDIRSRPRKEWGRLLRENWPRPMDASLGWTPEEGSAVICVVIVMKMIMSYTGDISQPEWVEADKAAEGHNILLKYAWHDTSEGVEAAAVRGLQEEVYTELMRPGSTWERAVSEGVTFEDIMESLPMWRHFWSRPAFTRWAGLEVEVMDDWAPLQRVLKSDGTQVSDSMRAKQSLIRWNPKDGTLEQRVLQQSIRLEDDQQNRKFRHVESWSRDTLECIRVEYDPGTESELIGFQGLARLSISPEVLEMQRRKAKLVDGPELSYRLIAVVKLGSPAHIRTYDKAGQYLVPRALSSRDVVCLSNDWELGQRGARYMLYYVLANPSDPPEASAALERGLESAVDRLELSNMASRTRTSSLPRNTPTAPRADRERASQSAPREGAQWGSVNTIPLGRHRELGGGVLASLIGDRANSPTASQGPRAPQAPLRFSPPRRYRPHSPDPPEPRPTPPAPRAPQAPLRFSPPRRYRPHSPDPPEPLPANDSQRAEASGRPAGATAIPSRFIKTLENSIVRKRKLSPDNDSQRAEASGRPAGAKPTATSSRWVKTLENSIVRKRKLSPDGDRQRAEASGVPRGGARPSTIWNRAKPSEVSQEATHSEDDEQ